MRQMTLDQITPDFSRTRAALAHYDATYEVRAIEHNDDMAAWAAAERAALDEVRRAFCADTCDRNRLDQAMGAQIDWLREWASREVA
jgi:hypothetical protein